MSLLISLFVTVAVFDFSIESGTMGKKGSNPKAFFDITIGGDPVGKIIMEVCIHFSYHLSCFLCASGCFVTT